MCTTTKKLYNTFYAQNTFGQMQSAPQTAQEKAKLLNAIGYDGLEASGFRGYRSFIELKDALEKEGLKMPANYVALWFNADGEVEEPTSVDEIKAMIEASPKGALIYFNLRSNDFNDDKTIGDQLVSEILRKLSDYAAPFGVKLAVYPHNRYYCETVSHSVKLAKMVDRKNFGAVMNLCHLLKVEGSEEIDKKIKEFAPFLFAVNINGADDGDTRQFGWDRLIQPLGQGSFDTYQFVKLLRDNDYRGPIGLMTYGLTGDFVETLTISLDTWNSYKKRYEKER